MRAAARSVEALVIGGGPAGAAAAITLARAGSEVLLVERREFPRPKVCGGCLGPRAMRILRQLGLDPLGIEGATSLEQVRVHASGTSAVLPLPEGVAVDRADLDQRLLALAREAGVEVWTEARARIGEEVPTGRRVGVEGRDTTGVVTANVVVLATGLPTATPAARGARVGLSQTRRSTAAMYGPPEGEVWMISGARGYVGMVRFADGRQNVAASIQASALRDSTPSARVDEILVEAGLPALGWDDGWTGTPPLRTRADVVAENRVLPVGDAAGFWEPFTGEGIGWGLEAGMAVASVAIELGRSWDLRRATAWVKERNAWMRRVQQRSRAVAAISARPRIARAALGLIRRVPAAGTWLMPAASVGRPTGEIPGVARGAA